MQISFFHKIQLEFISWLNLTGQRTIQTLLDKKTNQTKIEETVLEFYYIIAQTLCFANH